MSKQKKYIDHNGKKLEFNEATPQKLIDTILMLLNTRERITLDYGDIKTGKSWGEENDITGYLSLTTGDIKGIILVHNERSLGGGIILDDCILSIKHSNKKNGGIIYKLELDNNKKAA